MHLSKVNNEAKAKQSYEPGKQLETAAAFILQQYRQAPARDKAKHGARYLPGAPGRA
jgi:hypothetical protein